MHYTDYCSMDRPRMDCWKVRGRTCQSASQPVAAGAAAAAGCGRREPQVLFIHRGIIAHIIACTCTTPGVHEPRDGAAAPAQVAGRHRGETDGAGSAGRRRYVVRGTVPFSGTSRRVTGVDSLSVSLCLSACLSACLESCLAAQETPRGWAASSRSLASWAVGGSSREGGVA